MRIGICTHYIDKYPRSAPSLYQAELIRKLIKKTNLEIVLIHHRRSSHSIYKFAEEVLISRFPYLREKEIERLDLDLIHFNAIPWSWWPTIIKLKTLSIATVHGTIHWDTPHLDDYTPLILRTVKMRLEKQVAKHITHFIAVSKYVRNVLINKLNVPKPKVEVIYLPINHDVFKPLDKDIVHKVKVKYGIKTKYILHVSNFSKAKNPNATIKIFSNIKRRIDEEIQLVIVGSKWNNTHVVKMINKFGLQGYIKILEWLPQDDLSALYNGAEVLLHPSLHETFCFPLVEGMASGCPVVASNVMAVPEIAGDAAILCDPHDYECFAENILNLLKDSSLRKEMIKRGLQRARRFDWDDHVDKILSIYKKVSKYGI